MRTPVHGTSAYKYYDTATHAPGKKVDRGVSKRIKRKRAFGNAVGILIVTALAFVLLGRYAFITEKTASAAKLRQEYEKVCSTAVTKQFEMEQKIELRKVEEIATTQLGMQKPEKHQLVYIDMQNSDYVQKPQDTSNSNFFAAITGEWSKVMEYFN